MSCGRQHACDSNTHVVDLATEREGRKMVELRIPPPEARRVAAQLRHAALQLQTIQGDLEQTLGNLRGRWRGDAEVAYAAGFAKRVKRLDDRQMLLRNIARALEKIAEAGEQADQSGKAVAPN